MRFRMPALRRLRPLGFQFRLAVRQRIDQLEAQVVGHVFPSANFVARAQAADAETRFVVDFANVDAG